MAVWTISVGKDTLIDLDVNICIRHQPTAATCSGWSCRLLIYILSFLNGHLKGSRSFTAAHYVSVLDELVGRRVGVGGQGTSNY